MTLKKKSGRIFFSITAILIIIACGAPATAESTQPESTATQNIQIETESTSTDSPTLPATGVTQETAIPSSAPNCTVLQGLNLRPGPGTAYTPKIRVLPANSIVTPLGYAPKGIPGGSWAYVQDSASLDKGWVSAGPQYISCDIEVSNLPLMAFGTPLPPALPNTSQASAGPGTCGKGGVTSDNGVDIYDCTVEFSNDWLIQFKIIKNGVEIGETDGVQNVNFSVTQNENLVYTHTENNAPYCIFGGNAACNFWVLEDYFYRWETGGPPVTSGVYKISIAPTLDDFSVNLFWSAEITITLP